MAPRVAALMAVVDDVVSVPVGDLCLSELQEQIAVVTAQAQRLLGWVSAAAGQLDAASGGTVPTADGRGRSVVGWLAEATCISPGSAGAKLGVAGRLRDLPLVQAAVLDGRLTVEQAGVLTRLVGHLPLADVQGCQEQLIQVAAGRDPGQLSRYVAHLIATHCEPAVDRAEQRAQDARHLLTRTAADGSVKGRFSLPAGSAETLLTAIEALSRRQGDRDTRTAGSGGRTRWSSWPSRRCGTAPCPTTAGPGRTCPTCCRRTGPPGKPTGPAARPARPARPTGQLDWPTRSPPACPGSPGSPPSGRVRPRRGPAR